MQLLARLRLLLARRPWIYWLAVAVVAGAIAVATSRALAGIDAARLAWGRQQTVWVAAATTDPGTPIVAERRQVPQAVVPAGALDHEPASEVARQHIAGGEIITTDDIAAHGTAGLIPSDWVAFGVPVTGGRFGNGDHVVVYSGGEIVAAGLIVDSGESEVMVAVPRSAGAALASGLLANSLTVALSPEP